MWKSPEIFDQCFKSQRPDRRLQTSDKSDDMNDTRFRRIYDDDGVVLLATRDNEMPVYTRRVVYQQLGRTRLLRATANWKFVRAIANTIAFADRSNRKEELSTIVIPVVCANGRGACDTLHRYVGQSLVERNN